jgi:ABC-type branched-subunit amino acid transport system substrate-binding protein
MTEKKELSQLARQLLGNSNAVEFYTQQEFDAALAVAKAEIMTVAIQTSKQVIMIERQACADLVRDLAKDQAIGTAQVLESAAEAILNRIPSQRQ